MYAETFLQLAHRDFVQCNPNDKVTKIAETLRSNNVGAIIVRDEKEAMVGVVSERDVVTAVAEHGSMVSELQASEIMTRDVITCDCLTTMDDAQDMMAKHHIRHLVVVGDGAPIGMLSMRDALKSQLTDKVLEANVLKDCAIAARSY